MSEDEELVSRMQRGDVAAFEQVYHKYKRRLYQTALAITGDRGAAEEVLQDCFVRAYAARDRVDTSVPISPWLYRIIVNLSYNWANRNRRWPLALEAVAERLSASPVAGPESMAEGSERCLAVREAVAALPVKHRAVVVLFHFQGFSLQEIAYILDCPLGTVKSRLHRACEILRQRLSQDRRLEGELAGEVAYAAS
jgi:RNA polymerase sigma-70 factor (ECF subfamily)